MHAGVLGGSLDLSGNIEVGAQVALHLVFGIDSGGFFIETDGTGSGLTIGDVQLEGDLNAGGRFGFST